MLTLVPIELKPKHMASADLTAEAWEHLDEIFIRMCERGYPGEDANDLVSDILFMGSAMLPGRRLDCIDIDDMVMRRVGRTERTALSAAA